MKELSQAASSIWCKVSDSHSAIFALKDTFLIQNRYQIKFFLIIAIFFIIVITLVVINIIYSIYLWKISDKRHVLAKVTLKRYEKGLTKQSHIVEIIFLRGCIGIWSKICAAKIYSYYSKGVHQILFYCLDFQRI